MRSRITAFILIACSAPAFAQEVSDLQEKRPQRPPWEVALSGTWLPDTDIRGSADELEMREVKFGFTRRFDGKRRLEFSTGVNYTLRDIEAPASARLPDALHTLALQLGAEYRYSDKLTLAARISPGLSSDFEGTDITSLPSCEASREFLRSRSRGIPMRGRSTPRRSRGTMSSSIWRVRALLVCAGRAQRSDASTRAARAALPRCRAHTRS